jgi:DNA-binding NarL/FixJ family response regulator
MKLLLVDDHTLFREGVALLLRSLESSVEVLEAGSCEAALETLAVNDGVDIALMDLQLPGASGVDAIRAMRERHPDLPLVAVSSSEDKRTVLETLDAGAMGFVPKTSTSGVLKAALQLIMSNGVYLPPSVFLVDAGARRDVSKAAPANGAPREDAVTPDKLGLTPRQADVLLGILEGKSAKVISRELGLSSSTVKVHTTAVLRALRVTTRTQAVIAAGRMGLCFPRLQKSMLAS